MSVGRICRRNVFIANLDENVRDVARRMREHNVGTLVALDANREPVGIVTDRDIAVRVVAEDRDARKTTVLDVMTIVPQTVSEDTPIEVALQMMRGGAFRRVPVIGKDGSLVGLLSLDDVLDLLADEFHVIGELIRTERPTDESARRAD